MIRTTDKKNLFTPISRGFTLVETLVAISLLLIAVVGPMTFLTRSSQSTQITNQQIPAVFLAQEGLELVQQERDNEFLEWFGNTSHPAWARFRSTFSDCGGGGECAVEIDDSGNVQVTDCTATDDDCYLYYNDSNARSPYTYDDSGDAVRTPYRRYVTVEIIETNREARVVSRVEWRSGSLIDQQVAEVETALLNTYATN